MLNILIDYMKKYVNMSDAELFEIAEKVPIQAFEKGHLLQEQGQPIEKCYFVLRGLVRQFHYDEEGNEVTSNFFTEEQSVVVYSGKNGEGCSPFYLECLEPCVLVVGDLSTEMASYEENPVLEGMTRKMLENDLGVLQERYTRFISSTPEERYRTLLEENPSLVQRVAQHQLASYLGVTPESLSRIKKRVSSHLRVAK